MSLRKTKRLALVVSSRTQRSIYSEEATESSRLNKSRTSRFLTKHPPARPTYFMRALPHLRNSAIAIVTILALLIVPACGSLCARMNHCSSGFSGAASNDSDSCHHANISSQSDSETLSSLATCSPPSPVAAILVASDTSVELKSVSAANAAFSIDNPDHASASANPFREFSSSKESPQQSIPLENLSVLRI
jgi:hypothetical protein